MTDRVRRLMEYHFTENNGIGVTKRTVARIIKKVADKAGISKSCLSSCFTPYLLGQLHQKRNLHQSPPIFFRPRQIDDYGNLFKPLPRRCR